MGSFSSEVSLQLWINWQFLLLKLVFTERIHERAVRRWEHRNLLVERIHFSGLFWNLVARPLVNVVLWRRHVHWTFGRRLLHLLLVPYAFLLFQVCDVFLVVLVRNYRLVCLRSRWANVRLLRTHHRWHSWSLKVPAMKVHRLFQGIIELRVLALFKQQVAVCYVSILLERHWVD